MMDRAKLRLLAGTGGVVFVFTGLVALSVALIIVLSEPLGMALAVTSVALVFVGLGCVGLYIFLMPHRPTDAEINAVEEAGADALADVPVDTLKSFVSKRPVAATASALLLGYTMTRDPKNAARQAQRMFLQLL